ncbi:glycosyltransferase family 4 protein [Winogradskyella sp. A3E31]|uniref:glycosyltransferase family 4 protein n=1 Tax=Winogradskyella sp. A3E31 TaxID=3349637 RepID=UPI00398B490F
MKDLMIITSYYPPEIGAASNRIFHLANGLKEDYSITVVTPLPNYPTGKIFKGYKGTFKKTEIHDGLKVHRLWLYATNSKNKLQRLVAMLSYSFSILVFFTFNKIPKKVIVQSPPLLVAFTSLFFLRSKKRQLILNVSDLWPSAGLELGALKPSFSYRLLQKIERFNYKKADLILGQSEEILTHVISIFPKKKTFLYRNFPDFEPPNLTESKQLSNSKIKLVYAGLLGIAQGIFKLCKELDYDTIEFHIYGSGSEEETIRNFITENPDLPIVFHGRLDRDQLHAELLKYDLTIIPLLNRIYGSVPSKIFEYARLGLPMLYFGGGEGEEIIKQHHLGWVAEVNNYRALNNVLNTINIKELSQIKRIQVQKTALENFSFSNQLQELKKEL